MEKSNVDDEYDVTHMQLSLGGSEERSLFEWLGGSALLLEILVPKRNTLPRQTFSTWTALHSSGS